MIGYSKRDVKVLKRKSSKDIIINEISTKMIGKI